MTEINSSSYDNKLIKNIQKYVSQAAWLVSYDWTLPYLIKAAFPTLTFLL